MQTQQSTGLMPLPAHLFQTSSSKVARFGAGTPAPCWAIEPTTAQWSWPAGIFSEVVKMPGDVSSSRNGLDENP